MNNDLSPEIERWVYDLPCFFLEQGIDREFKRSFLIKTVIDIGDLPPVLWGKREAIPASEVYALAETAIQGLKVAWKQTDTTREEMQDEVLHMLWRDEDFEEVTSEQ